MDSDFVSADRLIRALSNGESGGCHHRGAITVNNHQTWHLVTIKQTVVAVFPVSILLHRDSDEGRIFYEQNKNTGAQYGNTDDHISEHRLC